MFKLALTCPHCRHRFELITDLSLPDVLCERCNTSVIQLQHITGYLYVLTNKFMPGAVKIGFTTRTVEERIDELSSGTGVPCRFEAAAVFPLTDPERAERVVHRDLANHRVTGDREFFQIEPDAAVRAVRAALQLPATESKKSPPPVIVAPYVRSQALADELKSE